MAHKSKNAQTGCGITTACSCIVNMIVIALVAIILIFGLPGIVAIIAILSVVIFFIYIAINIVSFITTHIAE